MRVVMGKEEMHSFAASQWGRKEKKKKNKSKRNV